MLMLQQSSALCNYQTQRLAVAITVHLYKQQTIMNSGVRNLKFCFQDLKTLGRKLYKLYSVSGILKNTFNREEMVAMNNVHFSGITSIEPSNLEETSGVQASRQSTNWLQSPTPTSNNRGFKSLLYIITLIW